ncbi:hypothetical protein BaRGS_00039700 [Batillaria attramentaria]|uniref:Uncharacterized protein n=1 Tax=Batillaria attramentaria TaxID=370345 RepID=A0ABD0J2J1_9CAEN
MHLATGPGQLRQERRRPRDYSGQNWRGCKLGLHRSSSAATVIFGFRDKNSVPLVETSLTQSAGNDVPACVVLTLRITLEMGRLCTW